jgi:hypothetical protein
MKESVPTFESFLSDGVFRSMFGLYGAPLVSVDRLQRNSVKQRTCPLRLLAVLAILLPALHAWSQSTQGPVADAFVRSGAVPGVRFTSGLMVCDEELFAGRWVNRYWTSTGQIKPEIHLQGQSEARAGLPNDAFQLGIEGQNLAGTWKWVDIEQKTINQSGRSVGDD